jgi:putative addiction module component (TIGR02574 family)
MIDASLLAKVTNLSPADRLELVVALWDTLSPDDIPITNDERALLESRLSDMERDPDDHSSWSDVKVRLGRLNR